MINLFFRCFREITDIFKEGSGFFDDIYTSILESVINLVLSIILVQYLELSGIIIGTVISNILIIYILKPILVFKRCFDKNIKDYIKIYGSYLFLISISILGCKFMLEFISIKIVNSWNEWVIQSIVIGSITFIIVFIVFLSNKNFRDILNDRL